MASIKGLIAAWVVGAVIALMIIPIPNIKPVVGRLL